MLVVVEALEEEALANENNGKYTTFFAGSIKAKNSKKICFLFFYLYLFCMNFELKMHFGLFLHEFSN